MTLLLYGVAEAGGAPAWGVGLDDKPLQTIVEGPLAAIVSDHASAAPEPASERLRDYELTVRRLMERDAILPVRFGSLLADEGAARALLRRRRRDLLSRVRRVRGAVELALRASWRRGADGRPGVRPPSGTSYLRERLEPARGQSPHAVALHRGHQAPRTSAAACDSSAGERGAARS